MYSLINHYMYKKTFIFMLLSVITKMSAQDIIINKDGNEIQAKVLSVDENKVSYKKWANTNGITYSISTNKIFMIKYSNGDKDLFNTENSNNITTSITKTNVTPGYIEKQPDARNTELINKYNSAIKFNLQQQSRKAARHLPILGFTENSILSNEDIEINFIRKIVSTKYDGSVLRYYIEITNKTNGVIYIDKGNSFKTIGNIATPFYDPKQVSITSGSSSGGSLGLGSVAGILGVGGAIGGLASGMSVGGGTSSSVSTTYTQQRILAIPPRSSAYISEHKWENYKLTKWIQISEAEFYKVPFTKINKGECRTMDINNTPFKCKYFITYSTSPEFSTYSSVNATLYTRCIIGIPKFWTGATYQPMETTVVFGDNILNDEYSKIISDFEANPFIIMGDFR